ncbi:MAG: hypothetical protein K2X34_00240, partial [Hyphomonadaceae bacterium]|nr:hypothetical protein [Hyphomonadaceae bacterium]
KGRDDALKHYLVVAAALAAASQSNQIGAAALLVIPLVAAGMALSYAFHHVYLGVIVRFLRTEFAAAVEEKNIPFVNWDMSDSHSRAQKILRGVTLVTAIAIFGGSSILAFTYGMSTSDSPLVQEPWLCTAGRFACGFAGVVVIGASIMRCAIEKGSGAKSATTSGRAKGKAAESTKPPEPPRIS